MAIILSAHLKVSLPSNLLAASFKLGRSILLAIQENLDAWSYVQIYVRERGQENILELSWQTSHILKGDIIILERKQFSITNISNCIDLSRLQLLQRKYRLRNRGTPSLKYKYFEKREFCFFWKGTIGNSGTSSWNEI